MTAAKQTFIATHHTGRRVEFSTYAEAMTMLGSTTQNVLGGINKLWADGGEITVKAVRKMIAAEITAETIGEARAALVAVVEEHRKHADEVGPIDRVSAAERCGRLQQARGEAQSDEGVSLLAEHFCKISSKGLSFNEAL